MLNTTSAMFTTGNPLQYTGCEVRGFQDHAEYYISVVVSTFTEKGTTVVLSRSSLAEVTSHDGFLHPLLRGRLNIAAIRVCEHW